MISDGSHFGSRTIASMQLHASRSNLVIPILPCGRKASVRSELYSWTVSGHVGGTVCTTRGLRAYLDLGLRTPVLLLDCSCPKRSDVNLRYDVTRSELEQQGVRRGRTRGNLAIKEAETLGQSLGRVWDGGPSTSSLCRETIASGKVFYWRRVFTGPTDDLTNAPGHESKKTTEWVWPAR